MPVNYQKYVQDAYNRYMQMLYGQGGAQGYVSGQVRGAASAFQPYFNQMSTQGAAGAAGRGGVGGGAGNYALSNLYGQKTGALTQAASSAQRDVTNTGVQALGLGLQEASQLSQDEKDRLSYMLQKAYFDWQRKQKDRDFWTGLFGDFMGGGGSAAGYLAGG